jgi:hypothetical protein
LERREPGDVLEMARPPMREACGTQTFDVR